MQIIKQLAAVATVLLIGALSASAQDSTRTWSLGVDNQSGVYLGLALSPGFRLEPEVGVVRQHDKASFAIDNGFGTPTVINDEVTASSYRIGVGLLWQWSRIPKVRLYGGPRAGVILVRAEEEVSGTQSGKSTTSRTDWFVAGSLGAEYFAAERLSAGGDVQLRGIAQGSQHQKSSGSSNGVFAPSEPTLSTRGLLTVRFYL